MLIHRRSLSTVYLAIGALASFRRRHQGSVFAIELMRHSDEHAMEACQIGSRSGYQGYQACDKVQWFEDYKEFFADLKITPVDIRSFDDFKKIPTLTKETLQTRLEDLTAKNQISDSPRVGRHREFLSLPGGLVK